MPASTSGGRPVSSGRCRKSSAKSGTDEPSTSSSSKDVVEEEGEEQNEPVTKRDELRAILIGRLFAIMREQRDKTESALAPPEKVHLETETEEKNSKLQPLNDHIMQLEQSSCGMTLEDMLKDPKYATFSVMVPIIEDQEKEKESSKNKKFDPIEVKIEDVAGPSASNSVLPSVNPESNVERAAKREAHVLTRIAELRRNGLWSNSRLPKCVEPERNKSHWDYLLEEVKWMATDFRAETNTKRILAKKLAVSVAKLHRDKEIEVERAAERAIREKKKLCANVAKMIRDFWLGVDKVVDIRAKEILENRVRKARNEHLMFVIGRVDEMSNIVQEGLVSSKTPSIASGGDDKEFSAGEEDESDDERTIANEEKGVKKEEVKDEIDALNTEANVEMDDFLFSLPPEYLAAYGLTQDDLEEMRKENKTIIQPVVREEEQATVENEHQEEKNEPVTTATEASQSSSKSTEEKVEKLQDRSAEDGNGDGRGVLANVDYTKLNSVNSDERQKELANIAEEALKFQPKGFTLETTQVKTPVPFLIRGTLREYQMVGLDWMVTLYEKNLNGILADEMGLGKTIQTVALLAHLACSESIWGPHLIVVPTSVILNWEMEFKKWCPALKILTYFGSAKDRAEKRKGWTKPNTFHVCITSYKTVTQDIRSFKQRAWQYLILDEAQNIKNWKSQRWQALLNVRARRRLLLTGTPLQNSLMELWSLMHFLMPTIFSSHDDFKDWFSNPLTGMMEGNVEFNAPLIQRLHKVLRPFILRRLKKDVEKQLPEKTEHIVKCSLSKRQRYLYDDFMSRRSTKENLKSGNMMSVLNIVMQLRKCCNHPNLFEPRPVLSPFVVQKQQIDVPACLFEILEQSAIDEEKPINIPSIFNLSDKIGAWQTSISSRKPLIEELESYDSIMDETKLRPPIVEGFRFNRHSYVNMSARDMAVLSSQDPNSSEEEVKINGESNGVTGVVDKDEPQPTETSTISSSATASSRSVAMIRSKTVLNTAPLTIATERSGFHYTMANSGSRGALDSRAPQSPPLKKPKLTGAEINFADYVPNHVLERMDASRRNQLEIVRRRFGRVCQPIVANELLSLLQSEIADKRFSMSRKKLEILSERLLDYIDLLAARFGMFVEPVLTDAWQCRPSSSGLQSYCRNNLEIVEDVSRRILLETTTELEDRLIVSRSLQFPELRLIEYDCGKLQTLAILLRQLYVHKHRCLIFTQMSKMLDVLQTFLSHHGYQYFRLDGSTGIEQRQAMMERFNADSKVFCFILSTRSGGVGVNLTGADTVIFYDSDWNPTMDAQAQDRCHRIGQTRNVSIYRLISERTIEENILKKATQKRRLGELTIDEGGFTPSFFQQSDSIRDLFDGENVEVAAPKDGPSNEKELETVMEKCEDEADVTAAKQAQAEARVDIAEFDESAKSSSSSSFKIANGDEDADEKYLELINQLKPIERYAIKFLEEEYKPEFEEEMKEAEALIDQKREEWDNKLASESQEENSVSNDNDQELIVDDAFDNDFYLGGSLLDEVRNRRKSAVSRGRKSKKLNVCRQSARLSLSSPHSQNSTSSLSIPSYNCRVRSPSKRKSVAPNLTPYISSAHHAMTSPPSSPEKGRKKIIKKVRRRRRRGGGTMVSQRKTRTNVSQSRSPSPLAPRPSPPRSPQLPSSISTKPKGGVKKRVTIVEPVKVHTIQQQEPSTSEEKKSATISGGVKLENCSTTSLQNQQSKTYPMLNRSRTILPVKVVLSPIKTTPSASTSTTSTSTSTSTASIIRPSVGTGSTVTSSSSTIGRHSSSNQPSRMFSYPVRGVPPGTRRIVIRQQVSQGQNLPRQLNQNQVSSTMIPQRRIIMRTGSLQRVQTSSGNFLPVRIVGQQQQQQQQQLQQQHQGQGHQNSVFPNESGEETQEQNPPHLEAQTLTPTTSGEHRPSLGIYERPRLSLRPRLDSESSRN